MENTPQSNRVHVAILGETNAGKSALFNAILRYEGAIVADLPGTTTDATAKSMELFPYGPIVLTDTAGLADTTPLGKERARKTLEVMARADFVLYALDAGRGGQSDNMADDETYAGIKGELDKRGTPHLLILTKKDMCGEERLTRLLARNANALAVSVFDEASVNALKAALAEAMQRQGDREAPLIGGLLSAGSVVIMVVPIDSGAPKGRLILPQVQFLRGVRGGR